MYRGQLDLALSAVTRASSRSILLLKFLLIIFSVPSRASRAGTGSFTLRRFSALTSHPPTYYMPREDVQVQFLKARSRRSFCEFKGEACYWDLKIWCPHIPRRSLVGLPFTQQSLFGASRLFRILRESRRCLFRWRGARPSPDGRFLWRLDHLQESGSSAKRQRNPRIFAPRLRRLLLRLVRRARRASASFPSDRLFGSRDPCLWPSPALPVAERQTLKAHDGLCELIVFLAKSSQYLPDVHRVRISQEPVAEHRRNNLKELSGPCPE